MSDVLLMAFLFVGMPFAIMAVISWLLHHFVALSSPPTVRAGWIACISYILASAVWLFGGPEGDRWQGPLAAMPGALLIFWWWRDDFQRDWIDDSQGVPDGVELANTDWRVGLIGVVGLIVAAAVKVIFIRGGVDQ